MTSGEPRVNQMAFSSGGTKVGAVRSLRKDENGFGEAVHDNQSFGLASDGEALALEVHGVAGAGFVGGVSGEESVFTFLVLAICAVVQPATNVSLYGGPIVMASQAGMYFRVGEVGVMLACEGFAEGARDENARKEIGVVEDVETVAGGERESGSIDAKQSGLAS
jgi:hypothetical protein